jgi:hypothetical protein
MWQSEKTAATSASAASSLERRARCASFQAQQNSTPEKRNEQPETCRTTCVPVLVAPADSRAAAARAQAPAVTLTANSPELFEAFFRFHEDFNRWSDQRKAANALEAPSLDAALARELKLDRADLGKLTAVTQSVMADLRKIDDEAKAYLNARALRAASRKHRHPAVHAATPAGRPGWREPVAKDLVRRQLERPERLHHLHPEDEGAGDHERLPE